jgi:hypothetical protein
MHRVIAAARRGLVVDHIDGNTLNNSRANLRICRLAENNMNRGKFARAASRFKGVLLYPGGRWRAHIYAGGKHIHLGYFDTEALAAAAYDAAARDLHGEFARTNL